MANPRTQASAGPQTERQAQLEQRPLVQLAISVVLVLVLAGLVQTNLRPSYLRVKLGNLTNGYVDAAGLDQNWALFAPEPRKFTLRMQADVAYADGTHKLWVIPTGGSVVGGYWDYRWLKWAEYAVDEGHKDLWQPAAAWIASDSAKPGTFVTSVTLLRREIPNNPPGQSVETGKASVVRYYTFKPRIVG